MPIEAPLPKDSPLIKAWEQYKSSEEYASSSRWLHHKEHRVGAMWAAFSAGWTAACVYHENVPVHAKDTTGTTRG